jgi:hypothetical protein
MDCSLGGPLDAGWAPDGRAIGRVPAMGVDGVAQGAFRFCSIDAGFVESLGGARMAAAQGLCCLGG